MRWAAPEQHQLTQYLLDVLGREAPSDRNRETLAGYASTTVSRFSGRPSWVRTSTQSYDQTMVGIVSSPSDPGAIGEPESGPLRLFLWHRQAFVSPDPFYPLGAHLPPILV